jgi:hypothetical protein
MVNAALHSNLHTRLVHLGIPVSFQSIVINALETGGVPTSGHSAGAGGAAAAGQGQGQLVNEVIDAAYAAFRHGLHQVLWLSAALVFASGLLALFTLRTKARSADA